MDNKKVLMVISVIGFSLLLIGVSVIGTYLVLDSQNKQETVLTPSAEIPFEQDLAQVGQVDLQNHAENLNIDTSIELIQDENSDLIFMREEEKLARDVYLALYDKWGLQIFQNIAKSEQKHTDSLKTLLDSYNLEDPFVDELGSFTNPDLQALYTQLVLQGSISIVEALKVGALIEDLDIVDLEKAMSRTTNPAILTVYENLQRGSRNHIRSFTQTLSRYGESYTPTYLTQEEYLEIIGSGNESGRNSSGSGNGYQGGK